VVWNGTQLTTSYVSTTQLTAAVPSALIATAGTASVMISSPAPGGGPTIALPFTINPAAGSLPPVITDLSIANTANGGGKFAMAVAGMNFLSGATVQWSASARTTTFVNSTELAALLNSTDVSTVGVYAVTVTNPGSITSPPFEVAVDTPPGVPGNFKVSGGGALQMMRGSSVAVPVTFELLTADAQVSARCANLPSGASCSYSNGVVTITALPETPVGTYHALVVFTAQQRLAALAQLRHTFGWSALALLPFGFVFAARTRRRRAGLVLIALTLAMLAWAGCGSHSMTNSTAPAMTTSQESLRITLAVQ